MARPTVSDELWARIEPIIPKRAPAPRGGRPWIDTANVRRCGVSGGGSERVYSAEASAKKHRGFGQSPKAPVARRRVVRR
jgi:transposase